MTIEELRENAQPGVYICHLHGDINTDGPQRVVKLTSGHLLVVQVDRDFQIFVVEKHHTEPGCRYRLADEQMMTVTFSKACAPVAE